MNYNDLLNKAVIIDWRSDKEKAANPLTLDEAWSLNVNGNQNLVPRIVHEIRQFTDGAFYGVDNMYACPFPLQKAIYP